MFCSFAYTCMSVHLLFIFLFVCLILCLLVYTTTCLSIDVPINVSILVFICQRLHLSVYLSVYLSACLSIYLYMHPCVYVSAYLCSHLLIYPPFCSPVNSSRPGPDLCGRPACQTCVMQIQVQALLRSKQVPIRFTGRRSFPGGFLCAGSG